MKSGTDLLSNPPSTGTDPGTDLLSDPPSTSSQPQKPQQTRYFVPAGKKVIKNILKNGKAFAEWAARERYDAIIIPLTVFGSASAGQKIKQLSKFAGEFSISVEAGGRDLSFLVPRKYFLFHKSYFRMEEGKRKKAHHFCPTNPATIGIINKEGAKAFLAAEGIRVFHLWPDKGAESIWCSCPTCRAFTPSEQNRIAVNAAADVIAPLVPGASVTFFEKADEGGSIPLRKNLSRLEILPDEKEF